MTYMPATSTGLYIPGKVYRVTKSHNLATDNVDLFTVTGKVLITLLTGEVTTIVAVTTTYAMRIKTSAEAIFPALTITTDAAGTMYLFGGDNTVVPNNAGTPITRVGFLDSAGPHSPMVVGLTGGSAIIESDLDGAGTGVIRWDMWYEPLEAGASVVAA
jgi:hydrogenase maturation factor